MINPACRYQGWTRKSEKELQNHEKRCAAVASKLGAEEEADEAWAKLQAKENSLAQAAQELLLPGWGRRCAATSASGDSTPAAAPVTPKAAGSKTTAGQSTPIGSIRKQMAERINKKKDKSDERPLGEDVAASLSSDKKTKVCVRVCVLTVCVCA
jgi:hypothetical protein